MEIPCAKPLLLGAKIGDIMERAYSGRSFEETLRLCQKVAKTFQGSEETLKYIQRVEKCLRKLVDETK
jgi:hypothetical protein